MKIVIIGGTGRVGSRVVTCLREHGHHAVPASPDSGVNTLTGEGLAAALNGAEVVVDVSNSTSFEDAAVLTFWGDLDELKIKTDAFVSPGRPALRSYCWLSESLRY